MGDRDPATEGRDPRRVPPSADPPPKPAGPPEPWYHPLIGLFPAPRDSGVCGGAAAWPWSMAAPRESAPPSRRCDMPMSRKTRIVILGGGFGGVTTARHL